MANKIHYSSLIRPEVMNGTRSYRVKFSYGTFSVSVKVTQSNTYYYTTKRVHGRLFKTYIGKQGEITHQLLHDATMKLSSRIYRDVGRLPA